MKGPLLTRAALAGAAVAFCVAAILNCGGYRYGTSDQAFYIPAVVQHLHADLFPRDRALLQVQSGLMAFDDGAAWIVRATGISLPTVFFVAYLAALFLMFGAGVAIGNRLYRSRWTVALLLGFWSLRHRITQTGANTLEGYFHPRLLACALGLWAVACYLRGRGTVTLLLVAAAFLLHPTTAIWFGVWIAVAFAVTERRWRRPIALVAVAAFIVAAWAVLAGPLQGHLARMDPRWASALAGKDYIFPMDWTASFWIANLGYAAVILLVFQYRRRLGVALPQESGLILGAAALLLLFLLSWPLMRAWVALALQLQTSRVFWMLDLLAAIYLAWLLAEATPRSLGRVIVVVVLAVATARGIYVTLWEHRGSPFVELRLPKDNWTDVMSWIAHTAPTAHVLADPEHAWKYGSSVRVAGERDVYLEGVKDVALALYSRDVAMRVLTRAQDAHDFGSLTAERAKSLAARYDLHYLVIDHDMSLPLAYRNAQFRVYTLRPTLVK
jgi:hypothetical protein